MGQGIWYNASEDFHPVMYRVEIDMSTYATSGNGGGGVTPNPSEVDGTKYKYSGGSTKPTTNANALLRERGNLRWQKVAEALSKHAQPDIFSISITEANGDTQATSLAFTVSYERDAFNSEVDVADATSTLTGADCIAQLVATAISSSNTELRLIYQPESDNKVDQTNVTASNPVASYAAALATVTVTDAADGSNGIDNTAL